MVTKAWKVYTSSLSKKGRSQYWDWTWPQDGTRIFEVYCADLTGHTTYLLIRVNRDTEAACVEEFHEQLYYGFLEDYRIVRYQDIEPEKIQVDHIRVGNVISENLQAYHNVDFRSYDYISKIWQLAAALKGLGIDPEGLVDAAREANRLGIEVCLYKKENLRADYKKAIEEFKRELDRHLAMVNAKMGEWADSVKFELA